MNCNTSFHNTVESDKMHPLHTEYQSIDVRPASETERMWIDYGKRFVTTSIEGFQDRSKFMITTVAGLMVIQFGLSLAFTIKPLLFKLTPQFFLVISAIFFGKSLLYGGPRRSLNLDSPSSVAQYYEALVKSKYIDNLLGLLFFIAGLLAIAMMSTIQK
ncbi:MAG: hypothetical protein WCC17_11970 [Candidatus Nitrosopolaris sp.]